MKLIKYKETNGFTYTKLSEVTGLSRNMLYRICEGDHVPRLDEAYQIVEATDGYVRLSDLLLGKTS